MKCAVLFLVLSMVVLMPEPGECFLHHIMNGAFHGVGHLFHGLIHGGDVEQQQLEQLDKREIEHRPGRLGFQ
ncbi:moronecidin-like [Notolabrus celidotus]|uniref:moronecidin-like n=1 Tax=Notolabrus celidotus TaxID=1203425 RepID=UPI0014903384|nr:moronecidin-like [Notolabrus celidotus]